MGNFKKFLALTLVLTLSMTLLIGCSKKKEESTATTAPEVTDDAAATAAPDGEATYTKVDELYVYNSKGENADAFAEMAKAYETETGIKVKAFSIGSGQDHMETLRAEMNSKSKPDVFTIQTLSELQEWEESGTALDFNDATVEAFKTLASDVPQGLRLTSDGTNNYGIPYNVEGYGFIVDTQMISDLFGADNKDAVLAAIKTCTYDEWAAAVAVLDAYIKDGTAAPVTFSGTAFDLAATKTGVAANLTGVFAVAGSEKWTYGDHMINVAINAVFSNASEAKAASEEQIDSLKSAFTKYAQALDLKTSYVAGADGALVRGSEMINSTTNGYDGAVQNFADSKAIFMKQGNWVYANIQKVNAEVADRLTFLPVKMPITADDIKVAGLTPEAFNSTIPVFVPMYYGVNAKVDADHQKAAQEFLVWLNTSETGKKYITEDFAFIPYNADPATTKVSSCLGTSILEYLQAGPTLSNPYAGAPSNWSGDIVGLEIMEKYLTKAEWTDADYAAIADYAVSKWKEMK